MTSAYDFSAMLADGQPRALSDYRGKVLLVVNTATQCGFTPQLGGLEKLFEQYRDRGLVVLGFPCDQFAGQNPGSDAETVDICQRNYGVSFPIFSQVEVNGAGADPLFVWLKDSQGGIGPSRIKWNFTKFLIDTGGRVAQRYGPTTKPAKIAADLEPLLPV